MTHGVYRTVRGRTLRITESEDGALKVEVLEQGAWIAGPIGMAGLRLAPGTTRLTGAELRALPA
jgi:hypothetical protein